MKETPHKACPTVFTQSANAPYAQSLCGVALREGEKHAWADAKSTDKIIGKY